MTESRGYQWFIFLFTTAIVVICIINLVNYYHIKNNFEAYKVTLAFTADPIGNPSVPISPINIGKGLPYVNGDLVLVQNASLTGFQKGSFNVTIATYNINTGDATFTNATSVVGSTFGASTYNISPVANPDGMTEGAILAALWINWILLIITLAFWVRRVWLFFTRTSSGEKVLEISTSSAKSLGSGIKKLFTKKEVKEVVKANAMESGAPLPVAEQLSNTAAETYQGALDSGLNPQQAVVVTSNTVIENAMDTGATESSAVNLGSNVAATLNSKVNIPMPVVGAKTTSYFAV